MNVSNSTNVLDLDEIEEEYFLNRGYPCVLFLSILSIVGTIGNIHILLVYTVSQEIAKRQVRVFILWLSASDLIGCIACMPFEMFDIRFTYTFRYVGACKFFRFLSYVVSISSGGFLAAIAIQRVIMTGSYIPRQTSYPNRTFYIISGIIVGISAGLAVPALIFYGLSEENTNVAGVVGTDCAVLAEYKSGQILLAYGIVFSIMCTICFIICVACYGKILCVIYTQMKTKKDNNLKDNNLSRSPNASSTKTEELSEIRVEIKSKTEKIHNGKSRKRNGYEKGRQLTIGLIAATAVSYIGYMIYVPSAVVMAANPVLFDQVAWPADILLRAFWINNAANPVVFLCLDSIFREECLMLYRKLYRKITYG